MPQSAKIIGLGLLTAFLGLLASAVPALVSLETELGLDWLFALRGPRPAPAEVVVIAIDRESSDQLGLPNEPDQWPRSLHARLVRNVAVQGAQVIAFDVIFSEARAGAQDRLFAEAIREAGNVVLFEYLQREVLTLDSEDEALPARVDIHRRVQPLPELAQAAAAVAPFPLPRVPIKVSQVWLFKEGAGDVPTLPVAALQIYALPCYRDLLQMLSEVRPAALLQLSPSEALHETKAVTTLTQALRRLLRTDPRLARELLAHWQDAADIDLRCRSVLSSLIEMYSGGDSRYLDFYGPPRSIATVPYHQVLQESPEGLSNSFGGKAVFVGYSARHQPEQKDGHYTVFSRPDGLDLSGVEIAATAFANLLERRSVKPLEVPWRLAVVMGWGMALGALFLLLPAVILLYVAPALAAGYLGIAYSAFANDGLWLPVVVPLLQVPLALLGALLWRYLDSRKERQKIREVFGYYLPERVVDELTLSSSEITVRGQLVYGICLASDAEQYTQLSETLAPARLQSLLNRYYQTLFEPVKHHGGFVSDVIGDAMLAIWAAAAADRALREQACAAALDIIAAVNDFNRHTPEAQLPTRLGLHCGEIFLGNVGASHHYEYRAVGDIVNTATRIEGLNKQLGTSLLASSQVIADLDRIVTREVGSFRLAGKTTPLVIYELAGWTGQVDTAERDHYAQFASALELFRRQHWREAGKGFRRLVAECNDGPSRYYLRLCEQYLHKPPPPYWDGVVNLQQK